MLFTVNFTKNSIMQLDLPLNLSFHWTEKPEIQTKYFHFSKCKILIPKPRNSDTIFPFIDSNQWSDGVWITDAGCIAGAIFSTKLILQNVFFKR